MDIAYVLIGGALGSVARYLVSFLPKEALGAWFPVGTLAVNLLGSLLIGLFSAFFKPDSPGWLVLAVGMTGGFTTYSAFSHEAVNMLTGRQRGATEDGGIVYIVLTTAACLVLCAVGVKLGVWLNGDRDAFTAHSVPKP